MAVLATARLLEATPVSARDSLCAFDAGPSFPDARPGQFVHVRTPADVALRRPLSVAAVTGPGRFELLVRRRGAGTAALLALQPGSEVSVLGPSGNGFSLPSGGETAVLLAGGIGAAGLRLLARALAERGAPQLILLGAPTADELLDGVMPAPTADGTVRVEVATDDGSCGFRGTACDLLHRRLSSVAGARLYCCGPRAMLMTAACLAGDSGAPCELLMEEVMACGVGACRGCVVPTRHGYRAACTDGPVFDADDLVLDPEMYG
jgi:dihydroorotate dehydrogenase electron transfer subunit